MKVLKRTMFLLSIMFLCVFSAVPITAYASGNTKPTQEPIPANGDPNATQSSESAEDEAERKANERTYVFDTHDAVTDIMNNDRYVGAISSISWLTDRVDRIFMQVISVVAFFIISTSLLKNACAGAYCANTKFWNKVDEAHQKSDAWNIAKLGETARNFKQLSPAGVKDAILGVIPNIKALTDFEDAEIEPKHYFMRAIPQMIGCVIIGIFIYNGYYRDTASSVGRVGSEICNRVFASVDPTSFADKLTQTTDTPDNIYKNDASIQGQYIYAVSSEIYKNIATNSTMVKNKESKTSVMRNCEKLAYDWTGLPEIQSKTWGISSKEYEYQLTSLSVDLVPNTSYDSTKFVNPMTVDANGDIAFSYFIKDGDNWNSILETANDLPDTNYGAVYMQGIFKKKELSHNKASTDILATKSSTQRSSAGNKIVKPNASQVDSNSTSQYKDNMYTASGYIKLRLTPGQINGILSSIQQTYPSVTLEAVNGAKPVGQSNTASLKDFMFTIGEGSTSTTVKFNMNGGNGTSSGSMEFTITIDASGIKKGANK